MNSRTLHHSHELDGTFEFSGREAVLVPAQRREPGER